VTEAPKTTKKPPTFLELLFMQLEGKKKKLHNQPTHTSKGRDDTWAWWQKWGEKIVFCSHKLFTLSMMV